MFNRNGKHIHFRQVVQSDYAQVSDLTNSLYKIQRPEKYLYYHWNNNVVPSYLIGAFDNNTLIGVFGIQKKKMSNGLICGYLTNLNICKEWQGYGIFRKLGELAVSHYEDIDFLCVIANKRAKNAVEKSFGFKTVMNIKMLLLDNTECESLNGSNEYVYEPVTQDYSFPTSRKHSPEKIAFVYDQLYRRWRYGEHPIYKYSVVKNLSGDFSVVKIFIDSEKRKCIGDIVDIECENHRQHASSLIMASLTALNKHFKIDTFATFSVPKSDLFEILKKIGFHSSEYEVYFQIKTLKSGLDYLYFNDNWQLKQADLTNY